MLHGTGIFTTTFGLNVWQAKRIRLKVYITSYACTRGRPAVMGTFRLDLCFWHPCCYWLCLDDTNSWRDVSGRVQPRKLTWNQKKTTFGKQKTRIWLVVSTHLKNVSQIGHLSQIGVQTENVWNHHPGIYKPINSWGFHASFAGGVRLPFLSLQLFGAPQAECSSHPSACILFVAPVVDRQRPAPLGNCTWEVWGNFSRRKFHKEFQVPKIEVVNLIFGGRWVRARGLSYPKTKDLTPTAWHTAYPKIKDLTPILKTHWHTDVQIIFFG